MKRQTRSFVVEIKKKRGDAARKQSIWGGLDLSAIAAEATDELPKAATPQSKAETIEPAASEDMVVPLSTVASPDAQIEPDIGASDPEHAVRKMADVNLAVPKLSRRRRGSAELLPRGQRWKRRLPEVLRTKK